MEIEVFEGGFDRNLSYLIYDKQIAKAIVIDPFFNISIYLDKSKELNLEITGVLNTHSHRDHIEGNPFFEEIGIHVLNTEKDKIPFGKNKIKIIKVPGHYKDSVCFLVDNKLFTGDTLFAKRVGMTQTDDDTKELYESLKKLTDLPDKTIVYPGHKYSIEVATTIGKEKEENPYLKCENFEEFEKLINKWRGYHKDIVPMRKIKWLKYRSGFN